MDVALAGADIAPDFKLMRGRVGEVWLSPGAAVRLSIEQTSCLRVAPGEYALAYFDARFPDAGVFFGPDDRYEYAVEDRTAGIPSSAAVIAPPRSKAAESLEAAPQRPSRTSSGSCSTLQVEPTGPWQPGQAVQLCTIYGSDPVAGRVVAVHGPIVLARLDADSVAFEPVRTSLDSAAAVIAASGVAWLRNAIGPDIPETMPGGRQLLVVVRTLPAVSGGYVTSFGKRVVVELAPQGITRNAERALHLLAHEMAHAWQIGYGGWWFGWPGEGGADFAADEIVRRQLGVELTGNWNWRTHLFDDAAPYAEAGALPGGYLASGYRFTAAFLRDLLIRAVRDGTPYDTAVRELSRGVLEHWYPPGGDVPDPGPGLVARMREIFGPQWDPVDAVLTWTVSQALDDRSPAEVYQNPAFLRVAADRPDDDGWKADAILTSLPNGGPLRVEHSADGGSAGFFYLRAPLGGSYHLQGDGVAWMLARIR